MTISTNTNETNIESDIPKETQEMDGTTNGPPKDYTVIVERLTGTVKWFNNKAGFGFITVYEPGEYHEKDIFVHYTSIRVSNSQYKFLVQGEYVDFTLIKANNDGHEFQAMDVSGVKGGPIMCETRRIANVREPRRDVPFHSRPPRSGNRNAEGGGEGYGPRPPTNRGPRRPVVASEDREASGDAGDNLLGFTKVQKKRRPPAAKAH